MTYLEKLTYLTSRLTDDYILYRLRCSPDRLVQARQEKWLITRGMKKRIDKLYLEHIKIEQNGIDHAEYQSEGKLTDRELKSRRVTFRTARGTADTNYW